MNKFQNMVNYFITEGDDSISIYHNNVWEVRRSDDAEALNDYVAEEVENGDTFSVRVYSVEGHNKGMVSFKKIQGTPEIMDYTTNQFITDWVNRLGG